MDQNRTAFRIRTATLADAAAIARIYAPYVEQTTVSYEDVAPTPEVMAGRIAALLPSHPYLVYETADSVTGYAYASPYAARAAYRWSTEVSVYVDQAAHRRGIGRALYTELLRIITRQGFHAAFACVTLPNDKSVGLHEAMGFRFLGAFAEAGFKFGAWRDVGWWRRPLNDGPPTSEPIPFAALSK